MPNHDMELPSRKQIGEIENNYMSESEYKKKFGHHLTLFYLGIYTKSIRENFSVTPHLHLFLHVSKAFLLDV